MDEKKVYSIVGKVEIGTDEYRDLIERAIASEKEMCEYRSRYWAEQSKVSEAKNVIEALKKQVASYKAFVESDTHMFTEYRLFCITDREEVEE